MVQIIALIDMNGPMRYSDLEDALGGVSDSTLTSHLEDLVDTGLLERRSYNRVPPHVEYSLTSRGQEFNRRLQPLLDWIARISN